jgi:phosphoribosylglycinamide formyltransferase-1
LPLHLGWFSSGRDEADRNILSTVLKKRDEGLLDVEVNFVFCNWEVDEAPENPDSAERAKFFSLVRANEIPLLTLSWKKLTSSMKDAKKEEWRLCYGKKMRQLIYGNHFDMGVLAGYVLPLDGDTSTRFDLINLQPSLPWGPKGTRPEVAGGVIAAHPLVHGSSMRLCTPKWDEGPMISYASFSLDTPPYRKLWTSFSDALGKRSVDLLSKEEIEATELFRSIRKEGERREPPLVTYTIKMFADGDLTVSHGKLSVEGRSLAEPFDLTEKVDSSLARGEF